ncbi:hypothetical protein [Mesorhizobium sp. L103C105A0]|uniref:hypothetical protein n=1 Tax=Mesorhizobium sp. L103C105A0 TaxID=1287074 RepID=UPI0003CFCF29|nr:hypothetical protein [Mesorhizobium sp. L103C105A0]ESZ78669.1 hypothetical protein X726_04165 [Mesorhizobium sp. L103C105A0]
MTIFNRSSTPQTTAIRLTERNQTIDWMLDRVRVLEPQMSVPEPYAREIDRTISSFKASGRFHSLHWRWPGAFEQSIHELLDQTEPRRIVGKALVTIHAGVLAQSIKTHGDVESDYLILLLIDTLGIKPLFKIDTCEDDVHFKSVRPMLRAHGVAIDVTVKKSPAPLLTTLETTLKTLVDRDVARAEHLAACDPTRVAAGGADILGWIQRVRPFLKANEPKL